jgi:lysozyme
MNTSENGYQLIRDEEGWTPVAKGDFGHMEIAYGHDLLPGESYPNGIDKAHGEFLLESDVAKVEKVLGPLFPATGTQNQWDALIDMGYECGVEALRQLLGHGWADIPYQLYHVAPDGSPHGWIHAGGRVLPGMVTRRQKEIALFNS